jgi:diguanylate cyclase (GGDEF)-like protein
MPLKPESIEQLGPQERLQAELTKLEAQDRDIWILGIFVAGALLLGVASLLVPTSFWQENMLEVRIAPQILFVVMMLVVLVAFYLGRREMEVRKLRLVNLQQALAAQSEHSASMMDALTNVFSRSFLRELLQGEIARADRNNRPLGLIMCDLDNFKEVNDRYGHLLGDYVLAQVAGILKSCVRGSDYVVRYGGDEFLVILSETDEPGARIVLERMRQKVEEWNRTHRIGDINISISLGHHQHAAGETADQAIAATDARMYADKQNRGTKEVAAPDPATPSA